MHDICSSTLKQTKTNRQIMFFRFSKLRLANINNYFSVQLWWIRIVGVAVAESRRQRCLLALYRAFILLIMFHVSCLFAVTVYLDVKSGSFEAVVYSLPQMFVMMISTFYLVYFQINAAVYMDSIAYMNANFHFRSAKGLCRPSRAVSKFNRSTRRSVLRSVLRHLPVDL